ncbi:MAG: hypothetical protein HeimC3_43460 [Candidatus Heimdallarchaeota archaeon LC_3]|nr:MAG: hypothetical protein HeimC3_43460 [Candidatus Heimdallarchaeota archaeon LC_3]
MNKGKLKIDFKKRNDYRVKIEALLPICLYLEDDIYHINFSNRIADIKIKRIDNRNHPLRKMFPITEKDDIRIVNNHYNEFSRTRFIIIFKPTINELKKFNDSKNWDTDPFTERSIDPLFNIGINLINKFIINYKYLVKDFGITTLTPWEINDYLLNIGYFDDTPNKFISVFRSKHLSASGIIQVGKNTKFNNSNIRSELLKRLKKDSSINIWDKLLLNSRFLYIHGSYSEATVQSFSALEYFLNNFFRNMLRKNGKSTMEIEKILKRATTERLLGEIMREAIGKNLSELSNDLWLKFLKYKKKRNQVVHQAYLIERNEANNAIETFMEIINQISI